LRGLAATERGQECYVDVVILIPVDSDSSGVGGFEERNENEQHRVLKVICGKRERKELQIVCGKRERKELQIRDGGSRRVREIETLNKPYGFGSSNNRSHIPLFGTGSCWTEAKHLTTTSLF